MPLFAQLPQHKEEEPAHPILPIKEETAHNEPYSVPADDDYVDEEIIDVPEAEKESDVLRGALKKRVTEGVAYYGVVQDIEQGKRSGERLYLVKYTDGDIEHLSADQVRVLSFAQAQAAGGDAKAARAAEGCDRDPDEETIDILEADKKSDALRTAVIKRVSDGVAFYGLVLDAMAAARLLYIPRLLKVAPSAPLILLDANRSWRDALRHDCLSMWLQATFVSQVLPHPAGPMLLSWCDFAVSSTRCWKHRAKAWARSHVPQAAWDDDSPQPCGTPSHTDVQPHWPCYECGSSFASHRALMAHSTAAHAAVSFASRIVFDVYCACCLTLEYFRTFVMDSAGAYTLWALTVEPASDALVQQLLDRDRRVRKASKHLSLEWHPKHLPAIRMHGPLQSWAHRLGIWYYA